MDVLSAWVQTPLLVFHFFFLLKLQTCSIVNNVIFYIRQNGERHFSFDVPKCNFGCFCNLQEKLRYLNYIVSSKGFMHPHQDGRVVKALDLSSNGRIVRVGSNPTPGIPFSFFFKLLTCSIVDNVILFTGFRPNGVRF